MPPHSELIARLRALHDAMRDALHAHLQDTALEEMSQATGVHDGDTIYALDTSAEEILLPFCQDWGRDTPFLLIAEGVRPAQGAQTSLPPGQQLFGCEDASQARFILICDPVDGTRPLMYDKRAAWILTGIAPNLGLETNLSHIEVAMQTELPTSKAGWSDSVWAVRGQGAQGHSQNLFNGQLRPLRLQPSGAHSIEGGFAMLSKFFIGSKGWLAALEEELMREVLGQPDDGQPQTFDDQYICNGGQLYELISGRDRFNADLRPLAHRALWGHNGRLCSHPYDLCTELIAREAGVVITDEHGQALNAPLDVTTPMTWIAYANTDIQRQIEPVLLRLLREKSGVA